MADEHGFSPQRIAELKALADYALVRGKVVTLVRAEAYLVGTDSVHTVVFDPPVPFKVSDKMSDEMITRSNDPWIDPIYDVDPVDPSGPQVANYRSFWCYGTSYNYVTGEQQPGDFAS